MRLLAALTALFIWTGGIDTSLYAENRPLVVVELFTSQGCSSCPPADKIFNQLVKRADVLALSLHVDYWDYIGWPDTLSLPEHTLRQKAYSHAAGLRTIYTPQMVIGGTQHVIGSHPMEIAEQITASLNQPTRLSLTVLEEGNGFSIEAKSATHMPLPSQIIAVLVHFTAQENVQILRGENAGLTMVYKNVVTAMDVLGHWDGQGVFRLETEPEGAGPVAVLLQVSGPGEILAAARLR